MFCANSLKPVLIEEQTEEHGGKETELCGGWFKIKKIKFLLCLPKKVQISSFNHEHFFLCFHWILMKTSEKHPNVCQLIKSNEKGPGKRKDCHIMLFFPLLKKPFGPWRIHSLRHSFRKLPQAHVKHGQTFSCTWSLADRRSSLYSKVWHQFSICVKKSFCFTKTDACIRRNPDWPWAF